MATPNACETRASSGLAPGPTPTSEPLPNCAYSLDVKKKLNRFSMIFHVPYKLPHVSARQEKEKEKKAASLGTKQMMGAAPWAATDCPRRLRCPRCPRNRDVNFLFNAFFAPNLNKSIHDSMIIKTHRSLEPFAASSRCLEQSAGSAETFTNSVANSMSQSSHIWACGTHEANNEANIP